MRHLISPLDFTVEETYEVLDFADRIAANPKAYAHAADGRQLATLFYEPSTRTRLSFESAMLSLGGQTIGFAGADQSSVSKGETIADTVRVVSCYADIIVMRHDKYMMVQSGGSHMKVFMKDIVYAEVYNRKVIIHTRDTNIEYYGKLQELSEIAGADFFRIHRAYLVHFKYVQKYDANCVTMENGTALIAKQNYSEFVKQYLKYNQRKGKEIG